MLKSETDTFHCVEYRDLERFIQEETGQEYDIVANQEYRNDSVHRFILDRPGYDSGYWEEFKATGEQKPFRLDEILRGLCADGKIPSGNYLICICW